MNKIIQLTFLNIMLVALWGIDMCWKLDGNRKNWNSRDLLEVCLSSQSDGTGLDDWGGSEYGESQTCGLETHLEVDLMGFAAEECRGG